MIHPASLVILILLVGSADAGPVCTTVPADTWLPLQAMRERIETDGYRIVVFKTTPGHCYEIYGRDKHGRRVEIYFDPVSGAPVKANVR
ncbi:MAG: PepSY domain-containing protein [Rhodoplanes sp.]|uniref:PepSY domain-containing protein n=1 Tax=Rhodoplanes sp. TaxID=1968906 RepID=UPI0017F0835A|nr:PepSY domain-containing protein [Rhodoplanes sp.]NVO12513.1 PepSY domain-containing protein [Rhodoplanes sp.]